CVLQRAGCSASRAPRARAVRGLCAERRGALSQEHRADPPPTRIATDTAFAEEGGRAVPARTPRASTQAAMLPKPAKRRRGIQKEKRKSPERCDPVPARPCDATRPRRRLNGSRW